MTRLIFFIVALFLLLSGTGLLPTSRGQQNPSLIVLGVIFLVLSNVAGRRRVARTRPAGTTGTPAEIPEAQTREILALLESGRKIEAIKRYRESAGVGLVEAKEYVESLGGGGARQVAKRPTTTRCRCQPTWSRRSGRSPNPTGSRRHGGCAN